MWRIAPRRPHKIGFHILSFRTLECSSTSIPKLRSVSKWYLNNGTSNANLIVQMRSKIAIAGLTDRWHDSVTCILAAQTRYGTTDPATQQLPESLLYTRPSVCELDEYRDRLCKQPA